MISISNFYVQYPIWWDGRKINEILLCKEIQEFLGLKFFNGNFYDINGLIEDEVIQKFILARIEPYKTTGTQRTIDNIFNLLKTYCNSDPPEIDETKIHFMNGTFDLKANKFSYDKEWSQIRLPIKYNPDAQKPKRWLQYLEEVFYEEDIPTLQEYFGYCLIPSTRAQSMLLIIGKGGEGKSRLAIPLKAILGDAMNVGSFQKLEEDRFSRADQEGKLLLVDDDMNLSALRSTNVIKMVVTSEKLIDLEKKGKQSYQGRLFVRLMGLGNGALKSLYDRTNGFYRRQIIITTKDRPADRVDDVFLGNKLEKEAEGITLWMIEGLQRLIRNNFKFSLSERIISNKESQIAEDTNIIEFMNDKSYVIYSEEYEASTKLLYEVYKIWCDKNGTTELSISTFSNYIKQNQDKWNILYSKHVHRLDGDEARGFKGIKPTDKYTYN